MLLRMMYQTTQTFSLLFAGIAREVGVGAVLGTAAAAGRLAGVLATEGVPALERAEGDGLLEVAALVLATLAEGALDNLVVVEEVEGALDELPGLDADDVEESEADDDAPLPGDANVLEEGGVEGGDVDDGEHRQGTDDDGPEEELVGVDVLEKGELALAVRVQAEHGAAQVLELPGGDKDDPGKLGEDGSTGAEDRSASLGEGLVAFVTQSSAVGTVDDNDKGSQGQGAHDDTVYNHIDDDLVGEDTALLVLGGLAHDIGGGLLTTQTEGGEGRGNHVDPENLEGRNGEYGEVGAVTESETAAKEDDLTDVGAEQVKNELLDVVKHATTLADGGNDGVELVVSQHNLGGRLGDVGTGTHGDTDISAGQRGGIVDTITSHGHEGVAATEGVDHAGLGVGSATSDNQRHGVDFGICHLVEIGSLLDNGLGKGVWQDTEVLGDDADLLCDSLGGLGVITSKHVNLDTGGRTFGDRRLGLATGRVVDASQTEKSESLFNFGAQCVLLLLGVFSLLGGEPSVPVAVADSQHTLALGSQVVHLVEDFFLELLGELNLVVAEADVAAQVQDSLNSTLGEDQAVLGAPDIGSLVGLREVVDDGHALNGTVKGELGKLLPAETLEGLLSKLETMREDLKGNLGRLASGLPLGLLLIVANGGQVAKGGRQQESLEAGRHLGLVLGLGLLGGLLVLQLLLGNVELENSGGTLLVVVALRSLLNLLFLLLELGVSDSALGRVVGALRIANGVGVGEGQPGLADNHGTLSQGSGLVGANVGDTTESFEGRKISDNDVGFSHDRDGDNHGNGEDTISVLEDLRNKRFRNDGNTERDGVNDNLASDVELVSGEHDDGQDDGTTEQNVSQSSEFPLQRGTLSETKELADGIIDTLGETNNGLALAVLLVVHGAAGLASLLLSGGGDLSHLGLHAGSDDDATATALADNSGGIGDVKTITNTDLALLGGELVGAGDRDVGLGDLVDGLSLTGQGLLVARQVHSLKDSHIGGHGVAHLEQDDVTRNDFGTVARVSCLPSRTKHDGQGTRAKKAKR
ncbi:LOW QUALITY PROTEIN: unnamed protein product [Colletotrichum tofieldiae]|nr:LOW QUALITY PROTEIN: unnamed protein product [Colletotrichum tofieldiae]